MNSIKLISVLCFRKSILQKPFPINNNKIFIYSKTFTLPTKLNFNLNANRYFSDKKPTDPKAGSNIKPDAKGSPPTCPNPDPKAKVKPVVKAAPKPEPKKEVKAKVEKKAIKKPPPPPPPKPKPKPKIPEIDCNAAEKIADLQCQFQKDDGKPVFLKMGFRDMILYRVTCGLSIIGLIGIILVLKPLMFNN